MGDTSMYIKEWVTKTLACLAAAGGHPGQALPQAAAVSLFDEFCSGIGVPTSILKIVGIKPQPGDPMIAEIVQEAFAPYGNPPPKVNKGKGKGFGKDGGWGKEG